MKNIAYFITPHGYGHASRACAVMEALVERDPAIKFHLFTTVPEWFFTQSGISNYTYNYTECDVGFIQISPTVEDIPATVEKLNSFYPPSAKTIKLLSDRVRHYQCDLLLCDVAPLGMLVAQNVAIKSVLIENFTWDFIYRGYANISNEFNKFANYIADIVSSCDIHIQTEPVCLLNQTAIRVPPIARKVREDKLTIRRKLNIDSSLPLVAISMGGTPTQYTFLEKLTYSRDAHFVVLMNTTELKQKGNLTILPSKSSSIYHPDLVAACDLLVGKLGYSTVAEAYQANTPLAYIPREQFPESQIMEDFVAQHLTCFKLNQTDFESGMWVGNLNASVNTDKNIRKIEGSSQAAEVILSIKE